MRVPVSIRTVSPPKTSVSTAYHKVPVAWQRGQPLGERDAVKIQVLLARTAKSFGQPRRLWYEAQGPPAGPGHQRYGYKSQEASPGSQAAPHNLSCFLYKAGKDLSRFCTTHVKISSGFTMLLTVREVENTRTSELLISDVGKKTSKWG